MKQWRFPGSPQWTHTQRASRGPPEIGTHAFRAHVDQGARVVETNETNNWSETFEYNDTRVADLRVRSVDWQPERSVGG